MGTIIVVASFALFYFAYRGLTKFHRSLVAKAQKVTDGDLCRYIQGKYLDCSKTKVVWNFKSPGDVGNTVSFLVKMHYSNGEQYSVSKKELLEIDIRASGNKIITAEELLKEKEEIYFLKVSFTVRRSGRYVISIKYKNQNVLKSPFEKFFNPGKLSTETTRLVRSGYVATKLLISTQHQEQSILIDARDEFHNDCFISLSETCLDKKFDFKLFKVGDENSSVAFVWKIEKKSGQLYFNLTLFHSGLYKAALSYEEKVIKQGKFNILVLTEDENKEYKSRSEKKNIYFDCLLIKDDTEINSNTKMESSSLFRRISGKSAQDKNTKKVYCLLTQRQIIVKEYFLSFLPWKRIASFRVNFNTEIELGEETNSHSNMDLFTIRDNIQPSVTLSCDKRNALIATYHGILHGNVGNSKSMKEKVQHFYSQVRKYHNLNLNVSRSKVFMKIDRKDVLGSTLQGFKSFSSSDWKKQLEVSFHGEQGIDWGGVSREWVQLICKDLFSSQSKLKLFRRFNEDPQALVLPSPTEYNKMKNKGLMQFAGKLVGKCLIESSMGQERLINARFARSFLAQIIGMPVTYEHFMSDDPDLYTSKISFILKNDNVQDLDLTFEEEIYDDNKLYVKTIELVPNGSSIVVTNENRNKYLNLIATYRLSTSVRHEVEEFKKGLNLLIPDHLLAVFNENELELVMCGSSQIQVDDMRKHTLVKHGHYLLSNKLLPKLNWFWSVVSSFTGDELARLVQFTTGSSQLPSGGFKGLEPKFTIHCVSYGGLNRLPTAHTCFNELILPDYESCEKLHQSLKVAITEGVVGFELS